MSTVHIRTTVTSETLVLPELKTFIGKTVDIQVTERSAEQSAEAWKAAAVAARQIADYDFDAWSDQRNLDARRSTDHLL